MVLVLSDTHQNYLMFWLPRTASYCARRNLRPWRYEVDSVPWSIKSLSLSQSARRPFERFAG